MNNYASVDPWPRPSFILEHIKKKKLPRFQKKSLPYQKKKIRGNRSAFLSVQKTKKKTSKTNVKNVPLKKKKLHAILFLQARK